MDLRLRNLINIENARYLRDLDNFLSLKDEGEQIKKVLQHGWKAPLVA
jgi:hypothetical protein